MTPPFGMTDKQFRDVILIGIVALAIYLWWKKKQAAYNAQAPADGSESGNDPIVQVFNNNPSQFLPPQIGVTVNVPSAFGGQYTPLFGFVGIAQGEMLA